MDNGVQQFSFREPRGEQDSWALFHFSSLPAAYASNYSRYVFGHGKEMIHMIDTGDTAWVLISAAWFSL